MRIPKVCLWIIAASLVIEEESLAQACPDEMLGGWETELPAKALFSVAITLELDAGGTYTANLASSSNEEDVAVWHDSRSLRMQSKHFALTFEGRPSASGHTVDGFVAFASSLYRISLPAIEQNRWSGTWSPLPVANESTWLDLYFDGDGEGGVGGYFFFRDDRLPSLYGLGTRCVGRNVDIREKNLGLTFSGKFNADYSEATMTVSGLGSRVPAVFKRMPAERQQASPGESALPARRPGEPAYSGSAPVDTGDGWPTASPAALAVDTELLAEMVDAVAGGELPGTHSILAAKSGVLLVEEYFHGFDRDMLHDMRSASKSLASTLIGLAIDRKLIDSSEAKILSFFPEYRSFAAWDPRKADISIRDLLTMSSGLDANDAERNSTAAEGAYQSQTAQPDWTKLALDAPMIAAPGTRLIYGGANPLILGAILDNVVGDRVEWFAEEALFRPLGINNYRIYMDPTGTPYMGGGMYLRPRDMLKIGQLYLDGGKWRGQPILSESWIAESFGKYGRLEPVSRNGNEYGYLWWHENYRVDGIDIESVEARGNGGQYIFVVPDMNVVVVMTSGNYRGGLAMTRQPQRVFERYLLPAFLE